MILSSSERLFQYLLAAILILLSVVMLYPLVHTLAISFSTPTEATRPGIHIIPKAVSLEAYRNVFINEQIWTGFRNTFFRTIVGTFLAVTLMAMAAYPLSKKSLPHLKWFTWMVIIPMFFSGGLIPTYLLMKNLSLVDSIWVYVLGNGFLFSSFSLLIMRNFFMGIPAELEESAKMDGASDITILRKVVIPLSKPVLATITLWTSVAHWNAWFDGLIYIQDPNKMVLQVFLRKLVVENSNQEMQEMVLQAQGAMSVIPETIKAATLVVAILPIVLFYPFLQKYFVKGTMVGAVKG
jgi:putative aldouronate transport system permease protein